MKAPLRVLIVEDSLDDTALLVRELERGGYDPVFERVDTASDMIVALDKHPWDIVLADYRMPRFDAPTALKLIMERGLDLPFIIVSGSIGEDTAVGALKAGASDYLMKDKLKRLIPAIERELREAEGRRERRRAEQTVQHLAYHDVLTGLPNRNLFYDRLQQAILAGQRETEPVALLLMDLDRFKEINDTLGHHHGDRLLQLMGERLQGVLRESDTVARLGGDEFSLLLPATDEVGAKMSAQKILSALDEPFVLENLTLDVKTSIGIALFPDHGQDADTLMRQADVAMYAAKQTRNHYTVYDPKYDQHSPHRLSLMGELHYAIDRNELILHYQPKVHLKSGRIVGVEALVRWGHPSHGLLMPNQFIPLAEQSGLIKPLTLWVISTALRQCRIWRAAGWDLRMAVNLSARSLQDSELAEQIIETVKMNSLPADRLQLEITESAIMTEPGRAMDILSRMKEAGIGVSIDDFGTGYSSLSYLKKLPVNELKIDKSFVTEMVKNKDDAVIVLSTIDLTHNLGLSVVAEGVEDKKTMERLLELGCDAAQGYYMGKPSSAEDLARWLTESPWGLKQA